MLKIVKIGGNIVDNSVKLQAFLADFASLGGDKILVHGGGKVATAISAALGIETVMIDGRRVTDLRTLEVVAMVYNGINKQIVSALQGLDCNAVGLCGADGRLVVSRRRAPVSIGGEMVDYGFVGDPIAVNTALVQRLAGQGYALVIAPITLDEAGVGESEGCGAAVGKGHGTGTVKGGGADVAAEIGDRADTGWLLNTNADTVAQTIAVAMAGARKGTGTGAGTRGRAGEEAVVITDAEAGENAGADVELIYCFEKQGVLADADDENSVIPRIDRAKFAELKAAGAVHSGMLPKLENAFKALDKGVQKVVICAAENIAKPRYGGTMVVK